jgi:hypothetical protein
LSVLSSNIESNVIELLNVCCPPPSVTPTTTTTPTPSITPPPVPSVSITAPIECEETLNISGAKGYYEVGVEVGLGIGPVTIRLESYNVPDMFQLSWNGQIVANSLFVGDGLPGTYPQRYKQVTQLQHYLWNGTDFDNIGIKQVNFTDDDFPNCSDTRADANKGKQFGVVTDYPTANTSNCAGAVELTFQKTSSEPQVISVIGIGPDAGTLWSIKKNDCPECIPPQVTPSISPSSVTPSITPSISITPTVTPTISITPTVTPTISNTPNWLLECDLTYVNPNE